MARVVLHLLLDERGRTLPPHPSVRTRSPDRYLECVLAQAASLRLGGAECEIALLTNVAELGRFGAPLASLGVEVVAARLDRSGASLLRTALAAAVERWPHERELWLPNADCVWVDPARVFAAAPAPGRVGCLFIGYPPGWEVGGPGASREAVGRLAGVGEPPPWVGGDLLCGSADALRGLLAVWDELRSQYPEAGAEQLLTLAGALGRVDFDDLWAVAARIQTGARHHAGVRADALELGLWHLPAEKGLSLRRFARSVSRGRTDALAADLADPARAARRLNVGRARRGRQLRDDAWVAWRRVRERLRRSGRNTDAAEDRDGA